MVIGVQAPEFAFEKNVDRLRGFGARISIAKFSERYGTALHTDLVDMAIRVLSRAGDYADQTAQATESPMNGHSRSA